MLYNNDVIEYFVDADGNYLGGFGMEKTKINGEYVLVRNKEVPPNSIRISEPPAHGLDKWNGTGWDQYEIPTEEKRQKSYTDEIGIGNEIDAVYKGLSILIPDLVKAGVLSAETVLALTPDKTAPADTPAGWLGKVADIKARNPKP